MRCTHKAKRHCDISGTVNAELYAVLFFTHGLSLISLMACVEGLFYLGFAFACKYTGMQNSIEAEKCRLEGGQLHINVPMKSEWSLIHLNIMPLALKRFGRGRQAFKPFFLLHCKSSALYRDNLGHRNCIFLETVGTPGELFCISYNGLQMQSRCSNHIATVLFESSCGNLICFVFCPPIVFLNLDDLKRSNKAQNTFWHKDTCPACTMQQSRCVQGLSVIKPCVIALFTNR